MTALVDLHDVFVVHPGPAGGVAALRGLTLSVREREVCVVLGPSGAGKSTLVRLLAGLERPSAGIARVGGLDLGRASATRLARYRAEAVGYADQHYRRALAPDLSLVELVALPLGLRGVGRRERRRRALALLERVGLGDRATASAGELSGGEQQRVALCAALVHRPALLVADEPTGELDAESAESVYALLAELVAEQGATAVVVSHDPRSTTIATRVVHVRDGRVSEEEHGEATTAVVARGGWLRVPEETLRAAGIAERATVALVDGAVELRPSYDAPAAARAVAVQPSPVARGGGLPAALVGVTRAYGGERVLDRLDLAFAPGQMTVVTGPSGVGKSTVLHLLAGLDEPDEGHVRIGDVELRALDREARAALRRGPLAVVGQTATLVGSLTAHENVVLALRLRGVGLDDAEERAAAALVDVGLAEAVGRPVTRLSAGERERVSLARALAAHPAVLVADEPTARLDAVTTAAVGALLAELARRHGATVICSTHDPLLASFADVEAELGGTAPLRSAR